MKTWQLLGFHCAFLLGCNWSHSAVAQGSILGQGATGTTRKADLLLPPPGSLPVGTGHTPVASPMVNQPPANALQQVGNTSHLKGTVNARVIARVNGSPILQEEVQAAANTIFQQAKSRFQEQFWARLEAELREKALEDMITEEAIIQDASIKIPAPSMKRIQEVANKEFDRMLRRDKEVVKLQTDDEIREYLQSQGKSVDLMRRQFIRSFIANQWIRELSRDKIDIETTRERLLEYYQNNPQEFLKKERVVWQHIYIDVDRYDSVQAARQVAETVWQLMKNSKTEDEFQAIVTKYADGMSKSRSGTGEGNFRGDIRPAELERFVFDLSSGSMGPMVETSRGYHLIKMVEHTPEEMPSFDKVCIELRRKLDEKIFATEYARISKLCRDKAFIERLDEKP
ncbi:MAG TPA: peptidylprolyl isomerase [Gemmatales bacterium]|nr:peptidylprolyl isomerase [Gemmatales bacterium]HMP17237.1 peptidylprolyl isomerase [Gemmatales bacterium]